MTELERTELRATAYHEAGHAIAFRQLRLSFKEICIIPNSDEGSLGHVLSGAWPKWFQPATASNTPQVRLRAEKLIISLYAGQIAQARFQGQEPQDGMGSDNQQAADLAYYAFGLGQNRFCFGSNQETTEAFMRFLYLSSRDLVYQHWLEVEFVAEALFIQQRLSRRQMIEAIDRGYASRLVDDKIPKAEKLNAEHVAKFGSGTL